MRIVRKCFYAENAMQSEVLAHFVDRQVKPTAFKHNNVSYAVKDIVRIRKVENPYLTNSGIKDQKYWIIAQDGTKAVLHWHRNTGDWTIDKILPAK